MIMCFKKSTEKTGKCFFFFMKRGVRMNQTHHFIQTFDQINYIFGFWLITFRSTLPFACCIFFRTQFPCSQRRYTKHDQIWLKYPFGIFNDRKLGTKLMTRCNVFNCKYKLKRRWRTRRLYTYSTLAFHRFIVLSFMKFRDKSWSWRWQTLVSTENNEKFPFAFNYHYLSL